MWTHINGSIIVEPLGFTSEQTEYVLKTVLNHLPVVESWREGEMEVYVNRRNGHNFSSSTDEYDDWTNLTKTNDGDTTTTRNPFTNPHHAQTCYVITVCGDLRSTELIHVARQFAKWITRLSKRVQIINTNVIIRNGERAISFDKSDWLDQNFEIPNRDSDNFTNWSEHLVWQYIFTKQTPENDDTDEYIFKKNKGGDKGGN